MGKESTFKTLLIALLVSSVCAVLVSGAYMSLKDTQEINKARDKKKNILFAAGVIDSKGYVIQKNDPAAKTKANIEEEFKKLVPQVINLETGEVEEKTPEEIAKIDELVQVKSEATRINLKPATDQAKIKYKPKETVLYVLSDEAGKPVRYVFPIYGKGLWSTMYGFIALESDLNTVSNITYYQHGETPGLGGEIANPTWQAKWVNKKVFDSSGKPILKVFKGSVNKDDPKAEYEVDGISGSTLTGNGVTNSIQFWLGENGFGPYLKRIRN